MAHPINTEQSGRFEIRFQSLFQEGRGFAFPCEAGAYVDANALSERGRSNYLFARAMVGREFTTPSIRLA
jgi:hypothetical protein